jgi:hypothetical protein
MHKLSAYHELGAWLGDHCLTRGNSKTRVSSMQKAQTRCPRGQKLKGGGAIPSCFARDSTYANAYLELYKNANSDMITNHISILTTTNFISLVCTPRNCIGPF